MYGTHTLLKSESLNKQFLMQAFQQHTQGYIYAAARCTPVINPTETTHVYIWSLDRGINFEGITYFLLPETSSTMHLLLRHLHGDITM
jgi:hypothetical protein